MRATMQKFRYCDRKSKALIYSHVSIHPKNYLEKPFIVFVKRKGANRTVHDSCGKAVI